MTRVYRIALMCLLSVMILSSSVFSDDVYRKGINCGGKDYTAVDGRKFEMDLPYQENFGFGYSGGNHAVSQNFIEGTKDLPLFQSERWGFSEYRFDVPKGVYLITFYFTEFYFEEPGKRVFDIEVEGKDAIKDLDIVSGYGKDKAVTVQFAVKVMDGQLNISSRASVDNAKISALYVESIPPDAVPPVHPEQPAVFNRDSAVGLLWPPNKEIDIDGYCIFRADVQEGPFEKISEDLISAGAYVDKNVENGKTYFYSLKAVDVFGNESETSEPVEGSPREYTAGDLIILVNCGGEEVEDENGEKYLKDESYNIASGRGYAGGVPREIKTGPAGPALTIREGFDEYIYDVPNGIYKLTFGFVEPDCERIFKRNFSVYVENRRVLNDLDIFARAGRYKLFTDEFITRVEDGQLNIKSGVKYGLPVISFLKIEPFETDGIPPEEVNISKADDREDRVFIIWDAAPENDVIGYNVYRSSDSGKTLKKLNEKPVGVELFKDRDVKTGDNYSYYVSVLDASLNESEKSGAAAVKVEKFSDDEFLDMVQRAGFRFFWDEADQVTGLIKDKTGANFVSVASVGFGLSAMVVAAEREYLPRDVIEKRVLTILRTLNSGPKKFGLYFHYLDFDGGPSKEGYEKVMSTIDSGLLLMGVITAGEYFGGEIKEEADKMIEEANWKAALDKNRNMIFMAWKPSDPNNISGSGTFHSAWDFYTDESIICTVLGISAPLEEHRIDPAAFYSWKRYMGRYQPKTEGYEPTGFFVYSWSGCTFTYQFAHCWIDFALLGKDNPAKFGLQNSAIDWHKNTVEATKAARLYCIDKKDKFKSFGENSWGLSACASKSGYLVVGAMPKGDGWDDPGDGTMPPYGAGSSLPFLPGEVMEALRYYYGLKSGDGERLAWKDEYEGGYGFWDSFNLDNGYVAQEVIGIDQGPLILAIENYRSRLIWESFMKNKYIREGLNRIQFEKKLAVK
ncbi:malectin domain-containing carbohydrate-binding protein [bacterium]|nr:malectin domain-containing carbohydrate-binding protein [bacterium]